MAENASSLDKMVSLVMEELLSGNPRRSAGLVRKLAETWPGETALSLAFALTAATAAIEDSFGAAGDRDPAILLGYRLSALVSADIHALHSMGRMPALAEDLLHFWRRVDPDYLHRT